MTLHFDPIELAKQTEYSRLFSACPQKASDHSFLNLWSWADEYGLVWAWTDGLVWIKQTVPKECFWAPAGNWAEIDWTKRFDEIGTPAEFVRVPEPLAEMWRDVLGPRVVIEESREHWDYLYDVAELISLKGNKFHKKKNLANQFVKNYGFEYLPLEAGTIGMALGMQEDWCEWRDCEALDSLASENRAIAKVLENWEKFGDVMGAALIVGEKVVAYTIAEALSDDTIVIHFEKGDPDFKGVYQAINKLFLERSASRYTIVNREQDLGNEGLRKAKLSYQPVGFVKKFRVGVK